MSTAVDPRKTLIAQPNYLGSMTFAALLANFPAASWSGYEAFASDWGANGTKARSNGTRWLAVGGQTMLKTLGDPVTGVAGTAVVVLQTLLPAGAWQTNDILRFSFTLTKSGTTDSLVAAAYIGTAGTTSDTAVTGFSAASLFAAANVSGGFHKGIKLLSATSAQLTAGSTSEFLGASGTALPAATVITSAATNALYVSLAIKSSSTNDTVGIQSGQIVQIT